MSYFGKFIYRQLNLSLSNNYKFKINLKKHRIFQRKWLPIQFEQTSSNQCVDRSFYPVSLPFSFHPIKAQYKQTIHTSYIYIRTHPFSIFPDKNRIHVHFTYKTQPTVDSRQNQNTLKSAGECPGELLPSAKVLTGGRQLQTTTGFQLFIVPRVS